MIAAVILAGIAASIFVVSACVLAGDADKRDEGLREREAERLKIASGGAVTEIHHGKGE